MRKSIWGLALAFLAALVVAGSAAAQPPGRKGGPKGGPKGPRGGPAPLQRVVDDLKLPEGKKDTANAAVRAYQDNVRRLTEWASADVLLKMKEVLSPEELKKFREAVESDRPGPGRGPGGPGGRGAGSRLTADDIVARIMSFDKNKDGKITKDELPERMQDLIAKGDTNKDGVLDKAEIKKLADEMARAGSFPGRGPGRGPGGRGPGGPGRGPAFGGPPPNSIERAVIALKLSGTKKETATSAVKAYQENVRKMTQLARADLLLKMSDVLGQDDLKTFKTALERQPVFGPRPGGPGGPPGRGPGGPRRP